MSDTATDLVRARPAIRMCDPTFIEHVARRAGVRALDVRRVLAVLPVSIASFLVHDITVRHPDVGLFYIRRTKARLCRNPRTGELIPVPAGSKLSFRPLGALKAWGKGKVR